MRPLVPIFRAHDALTDLGYVIGGASLFAMAAIYCWEVFTRYFLGIATDWANDTFANLLCVCIFAMAPHATRRGQHIAITLLAELVPKLGPSLKVFTAVLGTIMCLFAAWMSLEENIRQIVDEIVTTQNRPVPQWWMSVFITFGFFGSGLYFFRAMITAEALQPKTWITPRPADGMG